MAERNSWPIPEGINLDELACSSTFQDLVSSERARGLTRSVNGGISWQIPGGNYEQNMARIIANVQLMFARKFPQFVANFVNEDDDMIDAATPEGASTFIVENIGTPKGFHDLVGDSGSRVIRAARIFGDTHTMALRRTFSAWGLDLNLPHLEAKQNSKEGLLKLRDFLYGGADFSALQAFVLPLKDVSTESGDDIVTHFYYLKTGAYLNVPVPARLLLGKRIRVVPNQYAAGLEPYHWLDIYGDADSESEPFSSCGLYPNSDRNKIDHIRWHGVGEEVLTDFIDGRNGIKVDDVTPFDFNVGQRSRLSSYSIAGRAHISLALNENNKIANNDVLRFVTRQDETGKYTWLDIYKKLDGISSDQWPIVSSHRILLEEHKLENIWPGVERQIFLDYLAGDKGINFESLKSIPCVVGTSDAFHLGVFEDRQVSFNYTPDKLQIGDKVAVVPRRDSIGHELLELFAVDSSGIAVGKALAFSRIIDKKIVRGGWQDTEKNLLREYCGNKRSYADLEPIQFSRGRSGDYLNLWRDGPRKVYIVLSRYFGLLSGAEVSLIPDDPGGQTFLLSQGDRKLGRYLYDFSKRQFVCVANFIDDEAIRYRLSSLSSESSQANTFDVDQVFGDFFEEQET